jgi:hypothetical protein
MLYINENEKKHIKSLYYTKVINEQGYNQNITGSYVQPAPKNLQIDWNKIIEKYDIRTSDGIHNLLDSSELIAGFASAGSADGVIGIFHGLYYFYEGVKIYIDDEVGKFKSFFLGVFELLMALPGVKEVSISSLTPWVTKIKNSKTLDWLDDIINWFKPWLDKIPLYIDKAVKYIDDILIFLQKNNLDSLYKILSKIKIAVAAILNWAKVTIRAISIYTPKNIKKPLISYYKQKVDDVSKDRASSYYDKTSNFLNPNYNTTTPATNYNQLNATTQDTTNPIYYKPKVNPNQPNVKYTN